MPNHQEQTEHGQYYSEHSFWSKIKDYAQKAGKEVIEKALWLYYGAQDPNTPSWAKTVMIGALGYFILPLDAIPDLAPMIGYTDDLGVLAAAIATVAMHISDDTKTKARLKLSQWFDGDKVG